MNENKWDNPWGMTRIQLLSRWSHVLEWTDEVFSWTSPEELCFLAELASRSRSILEVGSHHGKSALVMALANPNAKLICIDNCENEGTEEIFRKNLAVPIADKRLLFVKGTSEWLKDTPLNHQFEMAFIDAGHLEADVTADIANTLPHMAPGSILCGHDYRINDPKDGVNLAVHAAFKSDQLGLFQSIWMVQLP